jgi:hypothetical protein
MPYTVKKQRFEKIKRELDGFVFHRETTAGTIQINPIKKLHKNILALLQAKPCSADDLLIPTKHEPNELSDQ